MLLNAEGFAITQTARIKLFRSISRLYLVVGKNESMLICTKQYDSNRRTV